jgi:hypothetical protein
MTSAPGPKFGGFTTTQGPPCIMQVALRYTFPKANRCQRSGQATAISHRLFSTRFYRQGPPESVIQSVGILTCTPKKRNFAMIFEPLT